MKNILSIFATVAILLLTQLGMAQVKPDTVKSGLFGTATSATVKLPKKDTIQCYFQVITGVVKGQLMGQWFDGWVVKPKGDTMIFSSDPNWDYYKPIYLYHDKKTRVTKKVINNY